MTPLAQALSAALLHFIWEGTAVAFLLSITLFVLRKRSANARYAACCAAMVLLAGLPIATAGVLYERPASLAATIVITLPVAISPHAASPRGWLSLAREWVLPLWAIGVAIFGLRLALAWRHVAQLRRAADSAESVIVEIASALAQRMKITKPVRLLVSQLADAPSVVGWLKPTILMPAAALAGLDTQQLEAILAHELAHIHRHDYLANILQTIVETLLFYHPAVWWVSSRMRQERELCCDDLAVRHCGDAIGYARALTCLERMRMAPQPAVAANGGSLLFRIQRLTGVVRECAPSRLPAILALAAVALCVPLAMHRAQAQPPQTKAQTTPAPPVNPTRVQYPAAAIDKGITGTVVVEATVGEDGSVADARVRSGPVELRKAALHSVLDWHFTDAKPGEKHTISIEYGPDSKTEVQVDLVPADEFVQSQQMALTRQFLQDEVAAAQAKLAAAAQQTESLEQLRADLADKERKLAAAQQAQMLAEDEQAKWQNDMDRQLAEANLAVTARNYDSAYGRTVASAMNAQLAEMRELLARTLERYGRNHPQIDAINRQVATLQRTLARFIAGRKLVRIDGDVDAAALKLPVAVGDTLTEESILAAIAAVGAHDPKLMVGFFPINDKEAGIRISRPH